LAFCSRGPVSKTGQSNRRDDALCGPERVRDADQFQVKALPAKASARRVRPLKKKLGVKYVYMQAIDARRIGLPADEHRDKATARPSAASAPRCEFGLNDQEVGMNPLTRRSAMLTVATLTIFCGIGTIFFASAQPSPASDSEICATTISAIGAEAPYLAENVAAMNKMMSDMAVKPTGDVDTDFVAMMVPHHQGAIDMALAVLRHGRNPQIRRLAQEIIVTQQQEIAVMRLAVGQPLSPSKPSPLDEPSLQRIESKTNQPIDRAKEP
jgi:hypothetical protein